MTPEEKVLMLKAQCLLHPEIPKEVLEENMKHADFVMKKMEEILAYTKALTDEKQVYSIKAMVLGQLLDSVPNGERIAFLDSALQDLVYSNKNMATSFDLLERLKVEENSAYNHKSDNSAYTHDFPSHEAELRRKRMSYDGGQDSVADGTWEDGYERGREDENKRCLKEIKKMFMGSSFESLPAKIMSESANQVYCIGCQDTEAVWEDKVQKLRKLLEAGK